MRGGNRSTRRKSLATSFRKCHRLKPEDSSPKRDSNPHNSIDGKLGKQTVTPRVAPQNRLLLLLWMPHPFTLPPRWPCGYGVRLESGRSRVRIPLAPEFLGGRHTSDVETGTQVTTLPGAWRYRVSAGTSRPGVNISAWQHVKLSEQIRP